MECMGTPFRGLGQTMRSVRSQGRCAQANAPAGDLDSYGDRILVSYKVEFARGSATLGPRRGLNSQKTWPVGARMTTHSLTRYWPRVANRADRSRLHGLGFQKRRRLSMSTCRRRSAPTSSVRCKRNVGLGPGPEATARSGERVLAWIPRVARAQALGPKTQEPASQFRILARDIDEHLSEATACGDYGSRVYARSVEADGVHDGALWQPRTASRRP